MTDVETVTEVVPKAIADELAKALRLTREYVGEAMLPPKEGWSWFDATHAYEDFLDGPNIERLYGTDSAKVWAEEFAKVRPDVDTGLMIGWFANAIETAKQIYRDQHPEGRVKDRDFVVLSRSSLLEFLGEVALPPWTDTDGSLIGSNIDCAEIATKIVEWLDVNDLGDLYGADKP